MIIGIGCDVVEHSTIEILGWRTDNNTLNRSFTKSEIELFNTESKNHEILAGRFAAKEAFLKCLGTGMQDGISLLDIEILRTDNCKPIINLHGNVKKMSDAIGVKVWHVSITHSESYSLAFVIGEK